jgi:hypothetical protein
MRRLSRACLVLFLLLPWPAAAQPQKAAPGVGADFVAPGPVVPLPPAVAAAVGRLHAANLAAHLELLAGPGLEGRGLGQQGLEAAADYLATSLALAGIEPPGKGPRPRAAYFQRVPIREVSHAAGRLVISTGAEGARVTRTFASGTDCDFVDITPRVLAAPLVFAGHGIREPSLSHDDYRGLDVKGKIVVVLAGTPAGAAWETPAVAARYGGDPGRDRFTVKVETAQALGARAVLGVESVDLAEALARRRAPAPFFVGADEGAEADIPLVVVSAAVGNAILGPAGLAEWASRPPGPIAGVGATLEASGDERTIVVRNVVGVIPGTDPALADEAVVMGAHMDHLGRVGDTVFPGADDNASGTAALIEIAKALAASPKKPRRTIVVAFWTGEEEGHLGSEYYVRHPLWPLGRTRTYLNLDMIAHPWLQDEIVKLVSDTRLPHGDEFVKSVKPADFVEPGVATGAPELCGVLEQAARGVGLALHFDRTDGKHGGSDYRAFARRDLPFIRFFGNYFPGYHEPTDRVEPTDAAQALKIARLALATAWLLADR